MADYILRTGPQDQKERGRYIARNTDEPDAALGLVKFWRMGEGFSESNESLNPQTATTNYINGKTSSVTTGYQESWAISGERYVDDVVNDMFAHMAETRAKGPDAAVIMVTVNYYEEHLTHPGIYHAYRQPATYSPESGGGGAATDTVTISGTVNGSGVPMDGWFLPLAQPTTDKPDLELRDWGIFSDDVDDLVPHIIP